MPVTINQLENKRIIIAAFEGVVNVEDVTKTFQESAEIMGDDDQIYHRITDVRNATSNFVEMLGVIKEASSGQSGSTTDPRIKTTFVGTTTWISFSVMRLKVLNLVEKIWRHLNLWTMHLHLFNSNWITQNLLKTSACNICPTTP